MSKEKKRPRILYFDIETAGVNALKADLGFVICFGWKFEGDDKAQCLIIDKEGLEKFSDKELLKKASKLFEQADLIVAHYGSVFDRRFLQGRMIINNLPPLPHTRMRDTCFVARSKFNFSSNRLGHLAKILKLKNRKLTNGWPENWMKVMQGNRSALRELQAYCKGDVECLQELYHRLYPFDNRHPRVYEDRAKCAACGGKQQSRGFTWSGERKYKRLNCVGCGRWSRTTTVIK